MPLPKVWDLIDRFSDHCGSKGWNAYKDDDLIEVENEYHKFFWICGLHLSTFRKVCTDSLCSIREGISLRTVNLSYSAWVLPEAPSMSMWYMVRDVPSLSRKVAIYDLSQAYRGEPTCLKLNETGSLVFQEFERYLNEEHDIRFTPLTSLRPFPNSESSSVKVQET